MKKIILLFFAVACYNSLFAQVTSADYAVGLTATTNSVSPTITLHWPYSDSATAYKVYRKTKESVSWGVALVTLTKADTSYADTNVSIDSAYEYKVDKTAYGRTIAGYIYAAIRLPASHDRGILLLVVDSIFQDSLPTEIHRLMKDISGDGWEVKKTIISRNDLVTNVKAKIVAQVMQDSAHTHAILLLGHIPVPYSGAINPDGHANHLGAWPADVYYADINGSWTDATVNDTSAGYALNKNIPGDGKFDNSTLPTNTELQISRIDFYNMPTIPRSEKQLMKSYLDKDHAYRQKYFVPQHRALVDDNFGVFSGEAFASCGMRNFAPLVGNSNIFNKDFVSTLDSTSFQWAYGCGGGSFTSASGIGTTTSFKNDSVSAIFTMLFGSYFGDWNTQNNFLRAPLCANDPALTNCWAGRPYWFFHHMALGENIGYSTKVTQNNSYTYSANYATRMVHIALMGDLTLKEDAVLPATALTVQPKSLGATLTWAASNDTIVGYYVYKSNSEFGQYKLVSSLLSSPTFFDGQGTNGLQYYMVRASKLQSSPSGKYFNLSEGITDTATVNYTTLPSSISSLETTPFLFLYPNPAIDKLFIISDALKTGDEMGILNMIGEKMITKTIAGDSDLQIDISSLNAGTYFLHILGKNKNVSKRFVVMR